jgi:hypothetical protein
MVDVGARNSIPIPIWADRSISIWWGGESNPVCLWRNHYWWMVDKILAIETCIWEQWCVCGYHTLVLSWGKTLAGVPKFCSGTKKNLNIPGCREEFRNLIIF